MIAVETSAAVDGLAIPEVVRAFPQVRVVLVTAGPLAPGEED